MRPVNFPTAPANYDEKSFKTKKVSINLSSSMSDESMVSEICDNLKALIDVWSSRSFVSNGKLPNLDDDATKNTAQVEKYQLYKKTVDDNKNYRQARRDLIDALGAYCSYCELPTSANLAVEHRLPKHYFPSSFLDWSNFLVACPVCNAIKSDNPYQLIDKKFYTTDQATGMINGTAGTFGSRPLYAWPQSYWTEFTGDLLPFDYKLHQIIPGKGKWTDQGVVDKVSHEILVGWYQAGRGTIQDNAYCFATGNPAEQPSKQTLSYYAVYVQPRDNLPGPGITAAVTNIINMTKLNEVNRVSKQQATDFRVALRTQAYFRAHAMRKTLETLFNLKAVTTTPRLFWDTVTATGFWSIWLTTFSDVPGFKGPQGVHGSVNRAIQGTANKLWTV